MMNWFWELELFKNSYQTLSFRGKLETLNRDVQEMSVEVCLCAEVLTLVNMLGQEVAWGG